MTMRVNLVIFSGRLTRDPDLRYAGSSAQFPGGVPVCNVTLAQDSRTKDGSGQWVKGDPIFVDVALWGKRAESFTKHHAKGDEAFIEGKLRYDVWDDKEVPGKKRTKLKVDADDWQFVPRGGERGREVGPGGVSVGGGPADDVPFG